MRRILTIAALIFAVLCSHASAQVVGVGNLHKTGTYLGQIGTRVMIHDNYTGAYAMSRWMSYTATGATNTQVSLQNFYVTANNVEAATFNTSAPNWQTTSFRASLEYPLGTCTQITWGGQSTETITAGITPLSDQVTGVTIPPGSWFAIRIYCVAATDCSLATYVENGALVPPYGANNLYTNTALGDEENGNSSSSNVPDQTASCDPIAQPAGNQYGYGVMSPAAVVAQTTAPSVCILGDSIAAGEAAGQNTNGDMGVVAQSIGPSLAYIAMAIGGTRASQYVTGIHSAVRQTLYPYCSHMINEYGLNDIGNGATAVQLEGWLATTYSQFQGPSFQTTIVPITTGTVATAGNQTVTAQEPERLNFNNALRAATIGPLGGYFDVEAQVRTMSSGNIVWKDGANFPNCGSSPYWVATGVANDHPTLCANNQIQGSNAYDLTRIFR